MVLHTNMIKDQNNRFQTPPSLPSPVLHPCASNDVRDGAILLNTVGDYLGGRNESQQANRRGECGDDDHELEHDTCNTSLCTIFFCSVDVDDDLVRNLTTSHAAFNLCSTPSTWDFSNQARQFLRKHLIQIVEVILWQPVKKNLYHLLQYESISTNIQKGSIMLYHVAPCYTSSSQPFCQPWLSPTKNIAVDEVSTKVELFVKMLCQPWSGVSFGWRWKYQMLSVALRCKKIKVFL